MENFTTGDDHNTTNFEGPPSENNSTLPVFFATFLPIFAGLNICFSITASLGNALILIALHKVTSIYPPTKLLFRCLAVTDLCVGLIVQPFYAIYIMSPITDINRKLFDCAFQAITVLSPTLCAVSILTSTAISVDRLLALLLGLRYRHVVTLRGVRGVMICFLLLSCSLGVWFLSRLKTLLAFTILFVLIALCLLTSVFSYIKIHLRLRHHQAQVQGHVQHAQPPNGGAIPLNIARYKKTVSSIAWVQLALLVCYLPFTFLGLLTIHGRKSTHVFSLAFLFSFYLVYFNSSLNPIMYCWKISEVKQAVKDTIRQLNCCCKSS